MFQRLLVALWAATTKAQKYKTTEKDNCNSNNKNNTVTKKHKDVH